MYIKKLNSGVNKQEVGKASVIAPFTTIINRANVEANCKVISPLERARIVTVTELLNERGPNGERVYTCDKEDSRIRFVGDSWEGFYSVNGTFANSPTVNNSAYTEVTFYGTGLNLLAISTNGALDWRVSIDGGAESSNIMPQTSTVTNLRNINANIVIPLAENLTEGWHTIKLRKADTVSSFSVSGFEFVNSKENLTVLEGSIFKNGYEYILENNTTINKIPTSYTGSLGGRVLTYIDGKSEVQQVVRPIVGSPSYLNLADHSNEVVTAKLNFKEFGRRLTTDFSIISTTNTDRVYTFDDNTTTLNGNNVRVVGNDLAFNDAGSYIAITFEGTGLDLGVISPPATLVCGNVYVDGSLVGTWTQGSSKVCANLPYGVHTVIIDNSIFGGGYSVIGDFYVYGLKKPELEPELPILADYNIMADYDSSSVIGTANNIYDFSEIPLGVIRKHIERDFVLENGVTQWSAYGLNQVFGLGLIPNNSPAGESYSYSFYGTGCVLNHRSSSSGSTFFIVQIDGVANDSGNPLVNATNETGGTYSGLLGGAGDSPQRFEFTGLSEGWHTIKVTGVGGSGDMHPVSIDVITTVHSANICNGRTLIEDKRAVKELEYGALFEGDSISHIRKSENLIGVLKLSTGSLLLYFDRGGFMDIDYLIFGSSNFYSAISTEKFKTIGIASCFTAGGSQVDVDRFQILVIGKTQKDILEDL